MFSGKTRAKCFNTLSTDTGIAFQPPTCTALWATMRSVRVVHSRRMCFHRLVGSIFIKLFSQITDLPFTALTPTGLRRQIGDQPVKACHKRQPNLRARTICNVGEKWVVQVRKLCVSVTQHSHLVSGDPHTHTFN